MLDHVFAEGAIGPLTLPHRVVMGSMHVGLEGLDDDGRALAAFYRERAAADAALIVTGGSAVSRVGAGGRNYSFVNEDGDAAKLARVADAIHAEGGRVLLQLFHAGRYAYERSFGLRPVAPSAVYSAYSRCEPRALSGEEVIDTIEDFARGAKRACELGFDGVELMGSEGYLLNQFVAPQTNLRDDDWGGDAERRMRFPLAVADAVRAAGGASGAVVYRISGADLVPGGATMADVRELAARLADGPVDALNVGIGWHEARVPTVQLLVPPAAWTPWARAIRDAVAVPVIASNRIPTLGVAEEVLAAGDADFVSLARPFLADPEIVAKGREAVAAGLEDAVRPARPARVVNVCIACDQACIDRSIFDRRVSCVVNPRAGYELELPGAETVGAEPAEAVPTETVLGRASARVGRMAVVGGGPAGMEAARALAAAGHRVDLFEAAERLGGQFRMACRIPGKEDYERTIEYFEAELERLGVRVACGAPVRDATALGDYAGVVVATGVTPRRIDMPGAELDHVVTYAELLAGTGARAPDPGGPVAVIGAGGIGVDVAHLLSHPPVDGDPRAAFYSAYGLDGDNVPAAAAAAGPRTVTLMRRGERVGERIGPSTRWAVLAELRRVGVQILTGVGYERIEPGAVVIRDGNGERRTIAADTVVIAAGQLPARALIGELAAAGVAHVVIGGAADAAELDAERAFREGAEAPRRLSRLIASRA